MFMVAEVELFDRILKCFGPFWLSYFLFIARANADLLYRCCVHDFDEVSVFSVHHVFVCTREKDASNK